MPSNQASSLLAGRNTAPLTEQEITRAGNTFFGLDREVNFQYIAGEFTRCRVYTDPNGEVICDVVFSEDIYAGTNAIDPNSSLSMRAAAAHELSHVHRWRDKTELDGAHLMEIDEALTSLDAIQRHYSSLNDNEIRQLVADAMQRLQMFAKKHLDGFAPP